MVKELSSTNREWNNVRTPQKGACSPTTVGVCARLSCAPLSVQSSSHGKTQNSSSFVLLNTVQCIPLYTAQPRSSTPLHTTVMHKTRSTQPRIHNTHVHDTTQHYERTCLFRCAQHIYKRINKTLCVICKDNADGQQLHQHLKTCLCSAFPRCLSFVGLELILFVELSIVLCASLFHVSFLFHPLVWVAVRGPFCVACGLSKLCICALRVLRVVCVRYFHKGRIR